MWQAEVRKNAAAILMRIATLGFEYIGM